MIFGNSMGIFEGRPAKAETPFDRQTPVSRGGGRHVAFSRVKMIPGKPGDFMAVQLEPYPGAFPKDIRSMGPYELPDYSSSQPSAEGIGQAPVAPTVTPAAAPAASEPWYQQLLKTGGQIYQAYQDTRKKPAATPVYTAPPQAYVSTSSGMSPLTITLLVGGGVAVLGVVAIILLKRK